MKELYKIALEVQKFCLSNNWKFCFIGGVAVQRWGEPRITQDIDLTIFTNFVKEEDFIAKLLAQYKTRIDNPVEFALMNRVVLLESKNKLGIDISLAGWPYEKELIERATYYSFFKNTSLLTCSAEDLIIMKAFANRPKDWGDVESIIIKQAGKLDIDHIFKYLTGLANVKEEPEILDTLNNMLKKYTKS